MGQKLASLVSRERKTAGGWYCKHGTVTWGRRCGGALGAPDWMIFEAMIEDYENPDRSFVWPRSAPVELDEANVNPNREDPFEEIQ